MTDPKIYAVIPARGGSKNVPHKNIRLLSGYPVIAYSIIAARLSDRSRRVIVSTDSEPIAQKARQYGAEVPFMRPAEFAADHSGDLEWVRHVLEWFGQNEAEGVPELLIHLRPTTPLRDPQQIDAAVDALAASDQATALRSVHELAEPPQKMIQLDEQGFFQGFFPDDPRPEYYNLPRQMFPAAYHPNGYVDILRSDHVKTSDSLHGPRILGFKTVPAVEIDRPEDFAYLEFLINRQDNPVYRYLTENFPKET